MRKHSILLFLLLAVTLQLSCQKNNAKFDALMQEMFEEEGPGGVALVVKNGKVLYRKAFGMANLELGVKMAPGHVFRIGSITKQFTACAILKLAEEGKLDLQDDITKYIGDYPTHGYAISLEHLLTHTSGIKSYTDMAEWTAEVRKKDFTPSELVDFFKNQPMDFAPGEEWRYNNSGYFLLGYIIEIVTGKSYAEYVEEIFFKPLGMNHSSYGSTSRIIPMRAGGYALGENGYKNDDFLSMTQPHGAGALISTVDDLHRWYTAVMNHEVISEASLKKATTPYVLNNGKSTGYGYGWFIRNVQGSLNITHGGGINGYLTSSMYLPAEKLFVAVFSNCTCHDPGNIALHMAAQAIDKPYEWDSISLDEKSLRSCQGVYTSEYDGDLYVIFRDGDLYAMREGGSESRIIPFEQDKFFVKEGTSTFHFVRKAEGNVTAVVSKGTSMDIEWKKTARELPHVEAIELEGSVIEEYMGSYQLNPDFILKVFREGAVIYTQATGQDKIEIIPVAMDEFQVRGIDAKLVFNRDDEGIVRGLTLHQNGEHKARKMD